MTDWNPPSSHTSVYAVGALGKPMPHRPEAEGAVRPENSMAVGFPDAASGPVAIRTGTLIRKTGCRGPLGTAAARHVIRWNRKALLVEDLLHQVGGGLGECELAEAGSMEARLALMIWLKVSFFMVFPFGRPPVFLLLSSSASRGSSLRCFLVSVSSVVFLLCLHYRQEVCVRHAAIAISIVDSSVHLKERIKKRSYILLRSLPQRSFG